MARPLKSAALPPLQTDEIASYIAEMSGELAHLAGRAKWPLLTYFLNMARVEAEALAINGVASTSKREAPAERRRKVRPDVSSAHCG